MPPAHPDNYTGNDNDYRHDDTQNYSKDIRVALVYLKADAAERLCRDSDTLGLAGDIVEHVYHEVLVVGVRIAHEHAVAYHVGTERHNPGDFLSIAVNLVRCNSVVEGARFCAGLVEFIVGKGAYRAEVSSVVALYQNLLQIGRASCRERV